MHIIYSENIISWYMKSYQPSPCNNAIPLGLPSFDLGVCEQLMGSKMIDDNKTRSTKGIRKPSSFRAVPRKLSISTGIISLISLLESLFKRNFNAIPVKFVKR